MGPSVTAESMKVHGHEQSKIKTTHRCSSSNYWAPLATILEDTDEEKDEMAALTTNHALTTANVKENKQERIIIDSGATSHFATPTVKIRKTNIPSRTQVYLPDGSVIQGSVKGELPIPTLPTKARAIDVLPQLQKSLLSVGKLADEGYTTIFHPREQGVTIHREGTIDCVETAPPEIQGWRTENGLWEMNSDGKIDEAHSIYSLPSIPAAIRYLHAAAGYPTKATWMKAIKAGNYIT